MQYKKLEEIVDIINGFPCKKEMYTYNNNNNIPIVRIQNMTDVNTEFVYYAGEFDSTSIINNGDLLFSLSGTIKPYIWSHQSNVLLNQRIVKIVPKKEERINKKFLYYYLLNNVEYISSKGNKCIINNVSITTLKNMQVPIFSIDKQNKIVQQLDEIISMKKNRKCSYDLLENLKYSLYVDFINDSKINFKKIKFSSCLCEITKGPFGSDIKKSLYVPKSETTYKVYVQKNILQSDAKLGEYYISEEYFNKKMYKYELKPLDYIVTCDGTLGKIMQLGENMEKGIISASLLKIRLNNNIINNKYFELLWNYEILNELTKDIRNACLNHLPSAKVIGNLEISIPGLESQTKFGEKINKIDKMIEVIENELNFINSLFLSKLMQYFK